MTVAQIIDLLRKQCYVEVSQMDDAELLMYINLSYHDIENTITTKVNESFFYQRRKTNVVDWQGEYTFEPSTATTQWFKKITQIEIKRTNEQEYFSKIPHESIQLFDSAKDVLEALTPASWGFFDLKDSSLFIYPTPSEDVNQWLVVWGIVNLIDLTVTDVETDIFPDHSDIRQFIPMLVMWAKPYVYQARGLIDLKNDAKNEYAIAKKDMIKQISNRDNSFMEAVLPNWNMYK